MPRTIAIVQARMGSSRLPGKVLLDLAGRPMLARVVERTRRAGLLDGVVVATTTEAGDDAVAEYCQEAGFPIYRGSQYDVLDRFYQAARTFEAQAVVRITADCPVIDPQVIDRTVAAFRGSGVDFAANRLPPPWRRTFPIGLDTEVCLFSSLEKAWREANQPFQREHVMPFFYEGIPPEAFDLTKDSLVISPRGFRTLLVNHVPSYGSLRWAVDTPQDLEFMRQVFNRMERNDFSWQDLLRLVEQEPNLQKVNEKVAHNTAFDVDARQKTGQSAGGRTPGSKNRPPKSKRQKPAGR
jgi:spore coat polysaccharide biosynthesis protein SpsF